MWSQYSAADSSLEVVIQSYQPQQDCSAFGLPSGTSTISKKKRNGSRPSVFSGIPAGLEDLP
jgi:hypothetical protein